MKAFAVQPKKENSLRLMDHPLPKISSSEVLIKTISVGVDGTDIEINAGKYGEAPEEEDTLIIGHEATGQIIETGNKVQEFKRGDYVSPTVRRKCGQCDSCRVNQPDACYTNNYTERGIKQAHGYLSEFFKETPENLVKIPGAMVDYGALVEPVSIAQKAVDQIFDIQKRLSWNPRTGLVLGAGPLGIFATIILKFNGIETYTLDIVEEGSKKAVITNTIGAKYVNGKKVAVNEFSKNFPKPDLIIDATGNSGVAFSAITQLNQNGIMCLLSITGGTNEKAICTNCINDGLVQGNNVVFGSVSSNRNHFKEAVKVISKADKKWPGIFDRVITEKLDFADSNEAFDKKDSKHIKSVIFFYSRRLAR